MIKIEIKVKIISWRTIDRKLFNIYDIMTIANPKNSEDYS